MAAAGIGLGAAVVAAAVLWLAWPVSPVTVNVRWAPGVDAAARTRLEARYRLAAGTAAQGTTWVYRLEEPSSANIRALILDPAVEDTAHLHRTAFRPELAQYRPARVAVAAVTAGGAAALIALVGLWTRSRGTEARAAEGRGDASLDADRDTDDVDDTADRRWGLVAVATAAPLLLALAGALWRTPYPISETVALLEDVQVSPHSYFDPTVRSWYRPLYHLTWDAFWRAAGSLDGALLAFKALEIASVVGLVLLFVRMLDVRTRLDAAAATCAVAVLLGAPGLRDNLELPLLMTLVGMPLAAAVWLLVERTHRPWYGAAVLLLTLVAIGYKEQGLVLAPLVVAAWWCQAPGARRSTALLVTVATIAYLAMRFSTRGHWAPFEQAVNIGFTSMPPAEAIARFGDGLWRIYAYNAAATAANILFSEPSNGLFRITGNLLQGRVAPWEITHLLSSTLLTGLIAWWVVRIWRREARAPWSREARLAVALVLAVAASAALGFNYARDRLGGMAVVFYAAAAFHAVREAARVTARATPRTRAVLCALLLAVGVGWQIRALGTLQDVRLRSEKNRREWLTDLHARRVQMADRATYVRILNAMAPQGLDPRLAQRPSFPEWWAAWLGEP